MSKLTELPWWPGSRSHKTAPSGDDDFADMGTAFGLDASLTPDAPAAPVTPPGSEAATPPLYRDRLNGRSVI